MKAGVRAAIERVPGASMVAMRGCEQCNHGQRQAAHHRNLEARMKHAGAEMGHRPVAIIRDQPRIVTTGRDRRSAETDRRGCEGTDTQGKRDPLQGLDVCSGVTIG